MDLPLYHFTGADNLQAIKKQGAILPHAELSRRGIEPRYSSSELSRLLDQQSGIDDFVFLAVTPCHEFLSIARWRGVRPVTLEVDRTLWDRLGVRCSVGVPTGRDVELITPGEFAHILRNSASEERDDLLAKVQVLVPDGISIVSVALSGTQLAKTGKLTAGNVFFEHLACPQWGIGHLLEVEESRGGERLHVDFEKAGRKLLSRRVAQKRLRPLDPREARSQMGPTWIRRIEGRGWPRPYESHCFACRSHVSSQSQSRCQVCGWLKCGCSACGCTYEDRG